MKTLSYPADENEFDKKATEMRFLSVYKKSNRGIGAKIKTQPEKVVIRDTKTGKRYGSRTLIQKITNETKKQTKITLMNFLFEEDFSALSNATVAKLEKLIRKGAADIEQQWANALELVHKAYQVANINIPTPDKKAAWQQYENLISYAVKQLYNTRGINGKWRVTTPAVNDVLVSENVDLEDSINKRKSYFFVEIPKKGNAEIKASNLDEIINFIINKLKTLNVIVDIEEKTENVAILSVLVDNKRQDKIIIKKQADQ